MYQPYPFPESRDEYDWRGDYDEFGAGYNVALKDVAAMPKAILTVTIHRYAGTPEDKVVQLDSTGHQYAAALHSAGYKGNVQALADMIDAGDVVTVEQFAITVYREDLSPDPRNSVTV